MKNILFSILFILCLNSALVGFELPKDPIIVMQTNQGGIELRLYPEVAPKAVENFIRLAENGYYNGITFHRLVKDFVIQAGDPTGKGDGGQSIWGKPFEIEVSNSVLFDRKGLLAMANAGPKDNGSQFFITLRKASWLNGKYTIFGEVISGFDVVEKINNAPRGWFTPDSAKQPQLIQHMYLK